MNLLTAFWWSMVELDRVKIQINRKAINVGILIVNGEVQN